ncbi:MAG: tRNA dihydrouridine(20/20a) synthase DusA [Pseudomonadota bacterium]
MLYQSHRFSVAPMMDWTDRRCRVFHRLMTRRALLFTEMVTAEAVIHGDRERLLGFSDMEHPVALQLGGSDPDKLAEAARIGAEFGYDEINLNVGCPSDRVQSGRFGACLMMEPALVGACVAAMQSAVPGHVPVTVKCRIGVDDQDSEADFDRFIETVADAGCERFTVHARKAWLSGLSPKENREVPPLDYDRVRRLKQRRADLTVILNGGIATLGEARDHLTWADGVMLGRAAYQTPALLLDVDRVIFGDVSAGGAADRAEVLAALRPQIADHLACGGKLSGFTRHILGLFHSRPRGRLFRQILSQEGVGPEAGLEAYDRAVAAALGEGAVRSTAA